MPPGVRYPDSNRRGFASLPQRDCVNFTSRPTNASMSSLPRPVTRRTGTSFGSRAGATANISSNIASICRTAAPPTAPVPPTKTCTSRWCSPERAAETRRGPKRDFLKRIGAKEYQRRVCVECGRLHPHIASPLLSLAMPKISLTTKIFIGLALGILLGWLKPDWGVAVRPLSMLFLNLIKSVIAPLIFSTLVIGIAGTGDIKQVGRIGFKSLLYFEIVTTFALVIGLAAVNITKPGIGVSLAGVTKTDDKAVLAEKAKKLSAEANEAVKKGDAATAALKASQAADAAAKGLTAPEPPAKAQTFGEIIAHLSPASIIKAMADGDVLQIVIFSVLFALAVTSIGEKAKHVVGWCESLADIMFRFTEFVMKFAPIGVGAAMANTIGHSGLKVLKNLGMLVGTLYGALFVFVLLVLLPVAFIFRVPLRDFFNAVKEPAT